MLVPKIMKLKFSDLSITNKTCKLFCSDFTSGSNGQVCTVCTPLKRQATNIT
jgi:hypothetical protein